MGTKLPNSLSIFKKSQTTYKQVLFILKAPNSLYKHNWLHTEHISLKCTYLCDETWHRSST